MTIGDFILIGGVLLFAIIGLVRGGAKMFFGLFMLLIIMLIASFLSGLICPLLLKSEKDGSVQYTSTATRMMDSIGEKLPLDEELYNTPLVKGSNGVYYVGETSLDSALAAEAGVGTVLYLVVEEDLAEGQTLRTILSYKVTEYIFELIAWVILVILLAILRNIVRKKIYLYLDNHSVPSKIDRGIGLVLNLVIIVSIFWLVGFFLVKLDGEGDSIVSGAVSVVTKGKVAGPFHKINPLLTLAQRSLPSA